MGEECHAPHVQLVVSGAHSFVNENKQNEMCEAQEIEEQQAFQEKGISSESNGIEPPPGFRDNGKCKPVILDILVPSNILTNIL